MSTRLDRLREELEELLRAPQEDPQALQRFARRVTAPEMDMLIDWMRDFSTQQRDLTASVIEDVWLMIEVEEYLDGEDTIRDAWGRFPEPLRDRLRLYLVRRGEEPPMDE